MSRRLTRADKIRLTRQSLRQRPCRECERTIGHYGVDPDARCGKCGLTLRERVKGECQ